MDGEGNMTNVAGYNEILGALKGNEQRIRNQIVAAVRHKQELDEEISQLLARLSGIDLSRDKTLALMKYERRQTEE